jgi:hypothetical protein
LSPADATRLRGEISRHLPSGSKVEGGEVLDGLATFTVTANGETTILRVGVSNVPAFYADADNHTLALNRRNPDGSRAILFQSPVFERGFSAFESVVHHEVDETVLRVSHEAALDVDQEVRAALLARRDAIAKAQRTAAEAYRAAGPDASAILANIMAKEGPLGPLDLNRIGGDVARGAMDAIGRNIPGTEFEGTLKQAADDGVQTLVLFVNSSVENPERFRNALRGFASEGRRALVVTADASVAVMVNGVRGVEALQIPLVSPEAGVPGFEDMGNGLQQVNVLTLSRGTDVASRRFAEVLKLGKFAFIHSSTVNLSMDGLIGEESPEIRALRSAVEAAQLLLSFLKVLPPKSIDWDRMNRVLAAIAQAA